jgi:hypothetical protein
MTVDVTFILGCASLLYAIKTSWIVASPNTVKKNVDIQFSAYGAFLAHPLEALITFILGKVTKFDIYVFFISEIYSS